MKRLIIGLISAAFIIAPMSASALEMMSDNNMKDVTGQAGVSIGINDVVIYQESLADVTYRDTDGLTVYSGNPDEPTATAGLSDAGIMIDYNNSMKRLITIDAIEDATTYHTSDMDATFGYLDDYETGSIGLLSYAEKGSKLLEMVDHDNDDSTPKISNPDYDASYNPLNGNVDGFTSGLSPLTIDIGTCSVLSNGLTNNTAGSITQDVAGVIIGLPTVEITTYRNDNYRDIKVVSNDTTDGGAINDEKAFIRIEESGYSKMAILGGTVEIAPH